MVAVHRKWQEPQKIVLVHAALRQWQFSLGYLYRGNDKADLPWGYALARRRSSIALVVLRAREDPEARGARRTYHVGGAPRRSPCGSWRCGRGLTVGYNPARAPHRSAENTSELTA